MSTCRGEKEKEDNKELALIISQKYSSPLQKKKIGSLESQFSCSKFFILIILCIY